MKFTKYPVATMCCSLLVLGAQTSLSNEAFSLEEIVVTAQKRAQNLQEVPISVSVVSGDDISDLGITELDQLGTYIPNVNIETSHNPGITIRGIGSGDNEAFEQSVGMYVDGAFNGRWIQYRNGLFDIDRVEVLRGPQGTLFGKNAIAGAISVHTARPTQDFEGKVSYSRGFEWDEEDVEAFVSGPLTENLSGRLAFKYINDDGFLENTRNGDDEYLSEEVISFRGTLLWESDKLTAFLKAENTDSDGSGGNNSQIIQAGPLLPAYQAADPNFTVDPDDDKVSKGSNVGVASRNRASFDDVNVQNYVLDASYELDSEATITSLTTYSEYDRHYQFDVDFSPADLLLRERFQDFQQLSQEFRYTSPIGETFEYMAGVFWQKSQLNSASDTDLMDAAVIAEFLVPATIYANYKQETETYAVFWQGKYNLNDASSIEFGIRYTDEEKEGSQYQEFREFQTANRLIDIPGVGGNDPAACQLSGAAVLACPFADAYDEALFFGFEEFELEEDRAKESVTWSAKYTYQMENEVLLYASVATGFKSGGFVEGLESTDKPFNYDDEEALAYEIGMKSELLDGTLRLNGAIFYTEIDELQTSQLIGTTFVTTNAGSAISQGMEVDLQWQATEKLYVTAGAAYNHARYDEFLGAGCTAVQAQSTPQGQSCSQDLSGEPLAFAPDWTATVGLNYGTYIADGTEMVWSLDWRFRDKAFLTQDNDEIDSQGAYSMTDIGVSLISEDTGWRADFIASNVFDKRVSRGRNDVTLTGALPTIPAGAHYQFTGDPRQISLRVSKEF